MSVAAGRIRRENDDLQRRLEELQKRQSAKRVSATRLQIDISPSRPSPSKASCGSETEADRATSPLAATDVLAPAHRVQLSDGLHDDTLAPGSTYTAHAERSEVQAGSASPGASPRH
jgi:hypothetical protein